MDDSASAWVRTPLRAPIHGRRPRVLIIDDEPMIGATLRLLLIDEHDVDVASSGPDARAMLLNAPAYDVILCDLMMPIASGMDLHAWLAGRGSDLAGRMIFMTGGVFTDDARTFLERVPNARVDKPFDHEQLLALIREVYVS